MPKKKSTEARIRELVEKCWGNTVTESEIEILKMMEKSVGKRVSEARRKRAKSKPTENVVYELHKWRLNWDAEQKRPKTVQERLSKVLEETTWYLREAFCYIFDRDTIVRKEEIFRKPIEEWGKLNNRDWEKFRVATLESIQDGELKVYVDLRLGEYVINEDILKLALMNGIDLSHFPGDRIAELKANLGKKSDFLTVTESAILVVERLKPDFNVTFESIRSHISKLTSRGDKGRIKAIGKGRSKRVKRDSLLVFIEDERKRLQKKERIPDLELY